MLSFLPFKQKKFPLVREVKSETLTPPRGISSTKGDFRDLGFNLGLQREDRRGPLFVTHKLLRRDLGPMGFV